jgi:hypothetical protein
VKCGCVRLEAAPGGWFSSRRPPLRGAKQEASLRVEQAVGPVWEGDTADRVW